MIQTGRQGDLYVISAPSGTGKSSLVYALLEADPGLHLSVSHTTRARRTGERDGVEYHFTGPAEFQELARRGEFLEHAVVHGNHYGTSHREVQAPAAGGRDVLLEIDWQGAATVRANRPEAVSVFILPPSAEELLHRLHARGQDSEQVIRQRMGDLNTALRQAGDYRYRVVNDDFGRCLETLRYIVRTHRAGGTAQVPEDPALLRRLLKQASRGR